MQTAKRSDASRALMAKLIVLAGVCAAIGTLIAVPRAEASKKHGPLTISPARPSDSQPLTVTWRPPYDWPAKGLNYQFEIVTGDGNTCERSATRLITKLWSKGDVVRGRLRPIGGVWCPGPIVVVLRAAKNQGSAPLKVVTLAQQRLTIRNDPSTPPAGVGPVNGRQLGEPIGSPVLFKPELGSTLTVRVPGRPERSAALSGDLRGFIPGRYVANRDFMSYFTLSNLRLSPLPVDPLCVPAPVPDPLAIATTQETQMTVRPQAKVARMVLVFAQDPLTLTGCQGPLPSAPRKLLLEAPVGAEGIKNLELQGTLGGLRLSEGVDAEITLKLVGKLEVSS